MIKYLLSCLLIFGMVSLVSAQNPIPNKYKLGEGFIFSDKEKSTMEIGGYVQPFVEVRSYPEDSIEDSYTRFRIRRLRLRMQGDLPKHNLSYRLQVDLSGTPEVGDDASSFLFDAWVAYRPIKKLEIKFGQSSNFTENREMMMSSNALQLAERSRLSSAFSVFREFGLFVSYDLKIARNFFIEPGVSVTNGDGPNVFSNDHGGIKYGGRIDFMPFGKFVSFGKFRQGDMARELSPKLLVGFNYSKANGISSRRGEASGAIIYLNEKMEESLPDYTKYGADFLFKYKGFSLLGEYIKSEATVPTDIMYRVRNDGSVSNNFEIDGVNVGVSNYVKSRMVMGSAYNIQGGYIFNKSISVDARFMHFDSDQYSFLTNATIYRRPNYYTIGLSKFFTRSHAFKIQGSFTIVDVEDGGLDILGNTIYKNEFITNVIATLSF